MNDPSPPDPDKDKTAPWPGEVAGRFARDEPPAGSEVSSTRASHEQTAGSEVRGARAPGQPQRIGRYRVEKLLGAGGFGRVFLAHDERLRRLVAIKMPHARLVSRSEDAGLYLAEARTVAGLDHPHIVPVYDVGQTDEFPCYVVSKYVEGKTLARRISESPLARAEAAELIATVAEALHYAHKRGLVHRDIKPGNILLDADGKPYVVDFGLALKESEVGKGPRYGGTPAYMSPEQARGEGHRVDGRSDIYSLGTVLYELLVCRRPFAADNRAELLEQIAGQEPKPPRQIDDTVPKELERVCLKALGKRASDRYTTALDMAEDLRDFLKELPSAADAREASENFPTATRSDSTRTGPRSRTPRPHLDSQPIRIVPKGLHSFDEHDADFFLELLSGPRDREGLPESIRFWKTRIEECDPDKTFPVGLIYGPSGCGKSSLVKAGLLPILSEQVAAVYVESTAGDTETRLLNGLRKGCHHLARGLDLKASVAALRRGEGRPAGTKVLLVLDQFEQWLHAKRDEENTALVQALRQCDGGNVQCLVLVRDDFWMAVTRFLDELEVGLVKGENVAAVDLFDARHARRVLAAFGRAYGALPENAGDLSDEQQRFLDQAVTGLVAEGKVICVRLALFAEMVKAKTWTPGTLRAVGGATGVGVTFLEETFSSDAAVPKHRFHQKAARAVLKALLPESGTDIRGRMRSREELCVASGYADRQREIDDLLHILDNELRLITPSDPEGVEPDVSAPASGESGQPYYQLTHDYLVPSLREWLTHKQKETARGRAELRLADRAAVWNAKPENRHLPSVWEYLGIVGLTSRRSWTEPQRRMMARAGRVHLFRWMARFALVLAVLVGGVAVRNRVVESQNRSRVTGLVNQLLLADVADVPQIVALLAEDPDLSVPQLSAVADDPERPVPDRLRATFALADRPGDRASRLIEYALTTDPQTLSAVRDRVAPFAEELAGDLWETARRDTSTPSTRLRAGSLLAVADRDGKGWQVIAPAVVDALLAENTLDLDAWVGLLQPVARALTPRLRERFSDTSATSTERVTAARVLARYANPSLLNELLLEADSSQYAMLFPATSRHRDEGIDAASKALRRSTGLSTGDDRLESARRLRNAAVTLLRLDQPSEVEALLGASADPTARTMLILQMRDFGVPPASLLKALDEWRDPCARQALLLAVEPYRGRELSPTVERALYNRLVELLRDGQHQAERSAAEWLLRRWGHGDTAAELTQEVAQRPPPAAGSLRNRDWWVTSEGHTMKVVRGPVTFDVGSPPEEPRREDGEAIVKTTIPHSFAASVHEVTMQQFERFQPDADFARDVADDPQCPANKVSFVDAMRYCRWLSEREGVTEGQMCYGPLSEIEPGDAVLPEAFLLRTGYRLLTEQEWEYVCRAGSTTPWPCGVSEEHLRQFAWFALSADQRLRPVGLLRPNQLGLFDMNGNVAEWCHSDVAATQHALRGGDYDSPARRVRSAQRYYQSNKGYSFTGFRIARTIASEG